MPASPHSKIRCLPAHPESHAPRTRLAAPRPNLQAGLRPGKSAVLLKPKIQSAGRSSG